MKNSRTLGIALLLSAVFMTVLALIDGSVVDAFNIYWMAAGAAVVNGALLVAGRKESAIYVSRIFVGSIFVVSGLIKANDTVGFAIKLEEYFDENALGAFWAAFHDWALPISFFVSGIEVLLGLALIFGAQARLVTYALLGMTLFFGWLTYFTAECNEAQMAAITAGADFNRTCVTDCGCFGDALRGSVGRSLTPWESFYKDLGLFFMVLVLVWGAGRIKVNKSRDSLIILPAAIVITLLFGGWLFGWMLPTGFLLISVAFFYLLKQLNITGRVFEWGLALLLAVLTYGFATYTYLHLPTKDYRPYAVGKNIKDQMKSADELGLEPTIYATVYKLEHQETGETKTMNSKAYLEEEVWKDKSWQIVHSSDEPIVIQRGYEPPIAMFSISNEEGADIGDQLLNDENYSFMAVMYDISKASTGQSLTDFRELAQAATAAGHHVYAVTSSPYDEYEPFRHSNDLAVPFYEADEIFLKTIVRANPGLLLLKNGEIVMKWHGNDMPTFAQVKEKYID
ncbi:MAG: MauE/DoxX family redox-associated membrane protein [Cryomorphaceae bacterium]|nr:DoxX family protein [Flavobacteriales bacterium]